MPIDPSVFDKIKTFGDYQKADQDFQLRKVLAAQQLQTGAVDYATKSNVYKTQLLSGAAAGGQSAYDQARQNLQAQGIDTSEFAPDVATASQQLNQARLAQSPLGPLLNAGLKVDANNIALGGLTGKVPELNGLGAIMGGNVAHPQIAQAVPSATPPQGPSAADVFPTQDFNPANVAAAPGQARGIQNSFSIPQQDPAMQGAPTAPQTMSIATPGASRFNPPQQLPNETIAAYNARVQQAFEAYKSDPAYVAAQARATKAGGLQAENTESAVKADELTKRLEMNLSAMLKLNPDVPSSGFIPGGAKVYTDQALAANGLSSGTGARAANQWDQINNQQIISEIQQFIASGGANTRVNQTLEKIVNAASGINRNDLPASREAQIKSALAEIQNKNVSAQNIAGGNQQYQPIPVGASQPPSGIKFLGFK